MSSTRRNSALVAIIVLLLQIVLVRQVDAAGATGCGSASAGAKARIGSLNALDLEASEISTDGCSITTTTTQPDGASSGNDQGAAGPSYPCTYSDVGASSSDGGSGRLITASCGGGNNDPAFSNYTDSSNFLIKLVVAVAAAQGNAGVVDLLTSATSDPLFVPDAGPPPAVVAQALVQQALQALEVPDPVVNFGPDATVAVNRWTYLWIDNPAPVTQNAATGAVNVTATATLSSVEWSMGEPIDLDHPNTPVAPFTCQGAGRDPGPEANGRLNQPAAADTCNYVYHWRSDADRTNGTGKWPVTATATWTVNWQSNIGTAGQLTLTSQSTTAFEVVEWVSVLVPGPPR